MALTQRLQIRQSQALVMTPQLQQAIKLLQLPNLELAAYVEERIEAVDAVLAEIDLAQDVDAHRRDDAEHDDGRAADPFCGAADDVEAETGSSPTARLDLWRLCARALVFDDERPGLRCCCGAPELDAERRFLWRVREDVGEQGIDGSVQVAAIEAYLHSAGRCPHLERAVLGLGEHAPEGHAIPDRFSEIGPVGHGSRCLADLGDEPVHRLLQGVQAGPQAIPLGRGAARVSMRR